MQTLQTQIIVGDTLKYPSTHKIIQRVLDQIFLKSGTKII